MKIALLLDNVVVENLPFTPIRVFSSNLSDKLLALRDLALAVDESIYIDRIEVDWILYCVNNNIRFDDFLAMSKYIPLNSRNIFLTEDNTMPWPVNGHVPAIAGNFYCRPHVFSILGNSYKLDNFQINKRYESERFDIEPTITKLVYNINRTGYEMQWIPKNV